METFQDEMSRGSKDPFDTYSTVLDHLESGSSTRGKDTFRPIFPDLVDKVIGDIYGFAYSRTHVDIKTRQLLTLAVLSTMGDCEVQLKFHLRGALNLGLTIEEIREVFVQVSVLAGNVRAVNAAVLFHEIMSVAEKDSDSGTPSHTSAQKESDNPHH